jgi:6-phosphogluconolactonase
MSGPVEFRAFESRPDASVAAAQLLAGLIRSGLASKPQAEASFVVSGGSTPGPCFDRLSGEALDWSRVTVVPSDERWVPADEADSNERLIRTRLLQGQADAGKVLSFFRAGIDAVQAPGLIELDLLEITQPFSASLLGMGEDGHFASLFPDYANLKTALDPKGKAQCLSVQTSSSPHLRISLTLSALINSLHIVLLMFGEAKRAVFETANTGGSGYPVAALLQQFPGPLTVIWAP